MFPNFRMEKEDSTEIALFVRTSSKDLVKWNRQKIVNALIRETGIDPVVADIVSREVENMIKNAGVKNITAPLVRELTNAKLVEYGLEDIRNKHARLGFPIYDVGQIIRAHNKENANIPHGPEATNLTLAEGIKKEYALMNVFSSDISLAHMKGDIHIHDLGFIDRPYCSGNNMAYVAKFGLSLPNSLSIARPAKYALVLLEHLIKFSAALQGCFAGAIGWDAVNIFLAPYLTGMNEKELKQLAQVLVYEFAQQAVARGGQSIFSDLNIYWECPKHFREVKAIGPGGKFTGNTYSDYLPEAQKFAKALFNVYLEGDANGRPFFFPKPEVHMTEEFFRTEGHEEFLDLISKVSAEKGNTYYVFDRGETAKISECCRLAFKLRKSDLEDALTPWKMRYSAMQNVTINLPRIAYESRNEDELFELLTKRIELAIRAHLEKRAFIKSLLDLGKAGPLSLLAMEKDGEPYYRFNNASFLIGMLGLNEMVQHFTGQEMHESKSSLKFGLKVIAHMNKEAERLAKKNNIKLALEQTPAESTAYRLAKLDLKHYPIHASQVVKGNVGKNEVYYTNSTYYNISAPIDPIKRVHDEGLFHPMIEAGALTHVWLGESKPLPPSISNFVIKTFKNTTNDQIAFSPEFTTCIDCNKTARGLQETCPFCNSSNIEHITRVTGFFSKVSSWNKGKLAELKDRHRSELQ